MNKLPLSTALLSVVIAVVLWYIAMRLDGSLQSPAEPAALPATPEFGRQVEERGVVGGRAAEVCRRAEDAMHVLVDDARYCASDSDCTIFDYGYPIQCLTSVASSEITRLRLAYRDYQESCEYRVYYDCPSEPMERHPVCLRNRCEVELRNNDFLQDETLQHLGIEDIVRPGGQSR